MKNGVTKDRELQQKNMSEG